MQIQCISKRLKGSITIFLALLCSLFLGFSLVILEQVYFQEENSRVQMQFQNSLEGMGASFDKNLWEKYGLFGIPMQSFGQLEYLLNQNQVELEGGPVFNGVRLLDQNALFLKSEIYEIMKYKELECHASNSHSFRQH